LKFIQEVRMSHPSEVSRASQYDAVVVGAGVTGIYQLARLVEMGLNVKLVEAGAGVGGTWYWNRYPEARFDSESYAYGYIHDDELLNEWDWSEVFPGQPEIERYFNHVVDRWDLRQYIQLDTRVEGALFDESDAMWDLSLSTGEVIRCRYLVPAIGILSAPYTPPYPNLDKFEGEVHHTSLWPIEPVDFRGKKVAVIGTGSTGVQIIPAVAPVVESLTVFQRTPNWCSPLNNHPLSQEDMDQIRASFDELRAKMAVTWMAFAHDPDERKTFEVSDEERLAKYEALYRSEGLRKVSDNFADMATDTAANTAWREFIASKIRERVKDPAVAEKLIPKDHGFGAKRPPMETNYFETYNRDNVELIETGVTPIVEFTATGIETTERSFDFDIVVLATGFDAVTGAMLRLNVEGVGGVKLADVWRDGPVTVLGVGVHGFPNLFIAGGPHVGAGNVPRATEHQVNFITRIIKESESAGGKVVATKKEAAAAWTAHIAEVVAGFGDNLNYSNNWYTGGNIPGKPIVYTQYASGVPEFRRRLEEEADNGFPGFDFSDEVVVDPTTTEAAGAPGTISI
jgi:cation diffusion facilitator CzcD-associated flavoprotein CzcO